MATSTTVCRTRPSSRSRSGQLHLPHPIPQSRSVLVPPGPVSLGCSADGSSGGQSGVILGDQRWTWTDADGPEHAGLGLSRACLRPVAWKRSGVRIPLAPQVKPLGRAHSLLEGRALPTCRAYPSARDGTGCQRPSRCAPSLVNRSMTSELPSSFGGSVVSTSTLRSRAPS